MSRRKSPPNIKPVTKKGGKASPATGALPPLSEDALLWERVTRSLSPLKGEHDRLHFGPLLDDKPALDEQWKFSQQRGNAREQGGKHPQVAPGPQGIGRQQKSSEGGRPVSYPAPETGNLSRREKRRIERGHQPIEARLDLHGMVQSTAHVALRNFISQSRSRGLRHVLVITGKGRPRSQDDFLTGDTEPGVLRRMVPLWLGEPDLSLFVSSYSEAPRRLGGEGALYVRLRRLR